MEIRSTFCIYSNLLSKLKSVQSLNNHWIWHIQTSTEQLTAFELMFFLVVIQLILDIQWDGRRGDKDPTVMDCLIYRVCISKYALYNI